MATCVTPPPIASSSKNRADCRYNWIIHKNIFFLYLVYNSVQLYTGKLQKNREASLSGYVLTGGRYAAEHLQPVTVSASRCCIQNLQRVHLLYAAKMLQIWKSISALLQIVFCKICNCGFYIHWLFPLFSLICRKCQGFVFSLRLGLHCELQHASGARTWIIPTDWG